MIYKNFSSMFEYIIMFLVIGGVVEWMIILFIICYIYLHTASLWLLQNK